MKKIREQLVHPLGLVGVICLASLAACGSKNEGDESSGTALATNAKAAAGGASGETAAKGSDVDPASVASAIGIEAGGFLPPDDVGADAVVSARSGTVALRRVGEELFEDLSADDEVKLYAGDQLRTGEDASATLTFADETFAELAEESVVAVGDSDATADPASSAAVLYGVARFSVSKRAPGEGPFLVYTAGGVIGTKGTTYAVGVSASGESRVGVENGEVEVAGTANLEAPVPVAAGNLATVSTEGVVGGSGEFKTDDWGQWRDSAEADASAEELVKAHVEAIEPLETEISADYGELEKLTKATEQATEKADEFESSKDGAAYDASAEVRGVGIEATFLASVRLQQLTYALMSRAYLAQQLYIRHPKSLEAIYAPKRARVRAALLYQKKYHALMRQRVRPLHVAFYAHTPRGRAHAKFAKHPVRPFFRARKLPMWKPAKVRGRLKMAVYVPPVVVGVNRRKRGVVVAPVLGWQAKVKVKPRRYRSAHWYVRPEQRRARVFAGVRVKAKPTRWFERRKLKLRGAVKVRWRIGSTKRRKRLVRPGPVGPHAPLNAGIKVAPGRVNVRVPAKRASPGVRAGYKVEGGRVKAVKIGPRGGVGVRVKTRRGAVKDVRVGPKGGVGVRVKSGRTVKGVKVGPRGKVKAGVKIKGGASIRVGPRRGKGKGNSQGKGRRRHR